VSFILQFRHVQSIEHASIAHVKRLRKANLGQCVIIGVEFGAGLVVPRGGFVKNRS